MAENTGLSSPSSANFSLSSAPLHYETVMALLPWIPGGRVLDLGTGAGTWAQALSDYGFQVTALDIDPSKIATLRLQSPDIDWQCSDLRSEHWSQQTYAAILCLNLFPFLPKLEHAQQLARLKSALKPGGILIFSAFSPEDPAAPFQMARDMAGEPCPTGTLTLDELQKVFQGWERWLEYQGPLADDHPPHGLHQHGVVQVIYQKPHAPPEQTDWSQLPSLGAGLGWRPALQDLLRQPGVADFIEIMSDDFLDPHWDSYLLGLSRQYTLIPHGVELSIGSPDGPNLSYLNEIARIVARCDSPWWSDHLCYTRTSQFKTWSLNPLPCTEEALACVVRNAKVAQQVVGKPLLLENPAYYWRPDLPGQMDDAKFLSRIALEADCGILLDVANLYGNAHNLGLDPYTYIQSLPGERVIQIHLAGGRLHQNLLFDTHDHSVFRETWDLLEFALKHCQIKAISVERDAFFDDLTGLVAEVAQARTLMERIK